MTKQKFSVLDGMRGIAALFVLTRHTGNFWGVWLFKSYLAVDLFFILSGFVIAHAYDQKLQSGQISNKQFVLIRIIRLAPVYLLALLLATTVSASVGAVDGHAHTVSQILISALFSAFFLPSYMPGSAAFFPLIGPSWSLFFELIANFLYAAFRSRLTPKALPILLIFFGALVAFCSFRNGNLDTGYTWGPRSIGTGLARCCFGFLFGLYLYKARHRISKFNGWFATLCVPVLGLAIILILPDCGEFNWIVDFVCVAVAFPIFVLLASRAETIPFESVWLALGSASYPIYVLHQPLARLLTLLFPLEIKEHAPWSGFILVLILVPATILLERRFDIPIRRWLSSLAMGTRKRAVVY